MFVGPTLDEAVAETLIADTAFWGRDSEWNIPLNAIWDDPADGPACLNWARDTVAAFGGNLDRLRALRATHDPNGVFATYPL